MVNWALEKIFSLLDTVIPVFNFNPELLQTFDSALAFVLGLIGGASWFIPLDILVGCFVLITAVDNWAMIVRICKWIIGILPLT